MKRKTLGWGDHQQASDEVIILWLAASQVAASLVGVCLMKCHFQQSQNLPVNTVGLEMRKLVIVSERSFWKSLLSGFTGAHSLVLR